MMREEEENKGGGKSKVDNREVNVMQICYIHVQICHQETHLSTEQACTNRKIWKYSYCSYSTQEQLSENLWEVKLASSFM